VGWWLATTLMGYARKLLLPLALLNLLVTGEILLIQR